MRRLLRWIKTMLADYNLHWEQTYLLIEKMHEIENRIQKLEKEGNRYEVSLN